MKITALIKRTIEKVRRWNVTGYFSCNKCGWKGDRPYNHDQRCGIEAVFVKPLKLPLLIACLALIGCKATQPSLPSQFAKPVSVSRAPLARSATLMWNGSASPGQMLFFLHWGTVSKQYTDVVNVGSEKTYTVTGLTPGVPYYFAASCVYSNGVRIGSEYSNESVSIAPESGAVVIVLWTGPNAQGPWPVALTTNRVPATNVQVYFNQTITLE